MDGATQERLAARIRALREARTTDLAPRSYRVPARDYTSQSVLASEIDRLFAGGPLLAGLSGDAAAPGDWFSFEGCGRSAVVWRGPDGTLRAFVNACRHRGMRVADGRGHAERALVCPYHSWSYDCEGRLAGMPGREGFADVPAAELGLTALPVHERAGLVWVSFGRDGDAFDLGGADAELAGFGLGAYHPVERRGHRFAANWKLTIDSFMEAYHLHFLHQETLKPIFYGNLSAFDAFGRHCRIVGVRRSFDGLAPGESLLPHVTLLYQLFPNAVLIHQQDHVELYQSFPDPRDPDACEVRVSLYAPTAPASDGERAYWRKNLDLIDGVTSNEDFAACARIQANLRAGAVPHLILGRNEPGVAHFHRTLHEVLGLDAEE
ncbi:MAG TPA: SRPBCC family protein [Candidatus Binatia bacterium]|jgi:nitrite reductase/ring-hydroxylating ferredoxin subunit